MWTRRRRRTTTTTKNCEEIIKYYLIEVESSDAATIEISEYKGKKLEVFYKGEYYFTEI